MCVSSHRKLWHKNNNNSKMVSLETTMYLVPCTVHTTLNLCAQDCLGSRAIKYFFSSFISVLSFSFLFHFFSLLFRYSFPTKSANLRLNWTNVMCWRSSSIVTMCAKPNVKPPCQHRQQSWRKMNTINIWIAMKDTSIRNSKYNLFPLKRNPMWHFFASFFPYPSSCGGFSRFEISPYVWWYSLRTMWRVLLESLIRNFFMWL